MILRCNYEELGALRAGATALLGGSPGEKAPVAAPPEAFDDILALLPRLDGDLTVETLAEQKGLLRAVSAIVQRLKEEMDASVLATHAAGEVAVASYFQYAHALGVLNRVAEIGQEMEALIEVVTGAPPTPETVASFRFPD